MIYGYLYDCYSKCYFYVMLLDGSVAAIHERCDACPDNCTIISHSVELSSGQISSLLAGNLLQVHRHAMGKDYAHALETRHRISEGEVVQTIQLLDGTLKSLHIMASDLKSHFRFKKHATLGKITIAIKKINQFVMDQVQLIGNDFKMLYRIYLTDMNDVVNDVITTFNTAVNLLKLHLRIGKSNNAQKKSVNQQVVHTKLIEALCVFKQSCMVLSDYELANETINKKLLPLMKYLPGGEYVDYCRSGFVFKWTIDNYLLRLTNLIENCTYSNQLDDPSCILQGYADILQQYPQGKPKYYSERVYLRLKLYWFMSLAWPLYSEKQPMFNLSDINTYHSAIYEMFIAANDKFTFCYSQYKKFLDKSLLVVDTFKDIPFSREFSILKEIRDIQGYSTYISELLTGYMNSAIPKSQLTSYIVRNGGGEALIRTVVQTYETCLRSIQNLDVAITSEEQRLSLMLIDAFGVVSGLQTYVPNYTNLTDSARSSNLWRRPSVDLDSSNVNYLAYINIYICTCTLHESVLQYMSQ